MSSPPVHLAPGDILLTRNNSFLGQLNARYQRRRRRAQLNDKLLSMDFFPTHAAMFIPSRHIIHSMKHDRTTGYTHTLALLDLYRLLSRLRKFGFSEALRCTQDQGVLRAARRFFGHGVDVESLDTFLAQLCWCNILHIHIPAIGEVDKQVRLLQKSLFHLDKFYNPFIELYHGGHVSAFCSQFIYDILVDLGIHVPHSRPEMVLPIDFLIWAIEYRWPIRTGYQLFSEISRDAKNMRRYGYKITTGLDILDTHRRTVSLIQSISPRDLYAESFNEVASKIIHSRMGKISLAELRMDVEFKLQPIAVQDLCLAADIISEYLTGCESHISNELETEQRMRRLSNPISWRSTHPERLDNPDVKRKRQVLIANALVTSAEKSLKDVDGSLAEASAKIRHANDTNQIERLMGHVQSDLFSKAVFFSCNDGIAYIERQKEKVEYRLTALSAALEKECKGRDKPSDFVARVLMYIASIQAYAVAWDVGVVSIWLAILGYDGTWDNGVRVKANNAEAVLNEMDSFPRMRGQIATVLDLAWREAN